MQVPDYLPEGFGDELLTATDRAHYCNRINKNVASAGRTTPTSWIGWSFLRARYTRNPWQLAIDLPITALYTFLGAQAPYSVQNMMSIDLPIAMTLPVSFAVFATNLAVSYEIIRRQECERQSFCSALENMVLGR